MRQYLMEFIGTMFLVLVIGLSSNPIAIGAMLIAMVYMGWHISGAHYNPAITLAVWMRGKIDFKNAAGYMLAQLLGAFVASIIFYLVQERTFAPAPIVGVEIWKSILLELLFTFALCSVYLALTFNDKLKGNYIYGLAIGFTFLTGIFAIGGISGGVLNPAAAFGPQLMDTIEGGSGLSKFYIYFLGCFAGGALSAIVYKVLNSDEVK
jgi:glycerol uptake facilitator-like aquaporin